MTKCRDDGLSYRLAGLVNGPRLAQLRWQFDTEDHPGEEPEEGPQAFMTRFLSFYEAALEQAVRSCGVGSRPTTDRAARMVGLITVVHQFMPHTVHAHAWTVALQPGHSSSVGSATTADGFIGVTVSIAGPSVAGK